MVEATTKKVIAALAAVMNNSLVNETDIHNNSSAHNGSVSTMEGGFLTGRNPFIFASHFPLPTFIVQLVIIVCMSRIIKLILSPIKQPAVIAEIISGILLGPTAFGHIPHFTTTIFPKDSLPFLNLMSNFGLVLFLFLVGLELDPMMLKKSVRKSLAISLTGMGLPFAMGAGVSYILYTYMEPAANQNGFTKYFLFLGVAMAITAFPVLARILSELDLLKTKVGGITISAAAVDDATSWCLLALVISLINAGSNLIALYVFLMAAAYSLFLVFAVRPIHVRILRWSGAFDGEPSQMVMFLTLCLVFISAFITDAIGIHAIFGGFLVGIIMPHEGGFAYHITQKLEDIVAILFLPLYFALSGLRTSIGSLNDAASWGVVLLVVFVACFGKIFGCCLAARATKMSWRESFTVGCLMNCKGLVELIVLNLGYDAHVISQRTFAIMVIMALVTTFITVPIVSYIYPPQYHDKPDAVNGNTSTKRSKKPKRASVLVCVNKIEHVPAILSTINLLQLKLNPPPPARPLHKVDSKSSFKSLTSNIFMKPDNKEEDKVAKYSHGVINALRLIELTERDSSVMLQTSPNALVDDPVTKTLRAFCEMTGWEVDSLVKVVSMNNFADALVTASVEVNAKYILIPWSGSGSMIEDGISSDLTPQRRRQSIHTPVQHANFIQGLINSSACSILILVDRGLDVTRQILAPSSHASLVPSYQQIYFPYFGGADDREALDILMGLVGLQGVTVNIIRYKVTKGTHNSTDSDLNLAGSEDVIVTLEQFSIESQDDELLTSYFGLVGARSLLPNIVYSEVESYTPVATAMQYLIQLSSSDLVVVGRRSVKMPNATQFKNSDAERRRVLGDLAESILLSPCKASVLVVQESKISKINGAKK